MEMSNLICITGYVEMVDCGHCGRALRHGIVTDCGTVGATCFARKMTAPRKYKGKTFRLDAEGVIFLARRAHNPSRFGITADALTFERAGA
jgi:hypothetical protein